ncbi:transcription termination factor 3, mitochondrial [Culicoides brevitarsis]|uniref:transcription termination factor 3, mitochondrial n=1 Tax=Culicoides brevitarsis TaxID=469753 RepID=UPI00307CAA5B
MQKNILLVIRALRPSIFIPQRCCHLQKIEELSDLDMQTYINEALRQEKPKSLIEPGGATELDEIAPYLKPTFNLAAYANKSHTLQQFLKMGVDLYKIEKRKGLGQFFLELDFEKHCKDHLMFLNDIGVSPDVFGAFITKNPLIFKESIQDLQTRVNYLEYKNFKKEAIVRIVEKNPFWLMFSTPRIDRRLGFFQKNFELTGNEVRKLATKQPRLITYNTMHVQKSIFSVKEEMGFSQDEMKRLTLKKPRIMMMNHDELLNRFEYIQKKMKLSHERILQTPELLETRQFILKQRHEFLKSLKRDQYDPKLPLYVPLEALVKSSNEEFVTVIAKSCMEEYEKFLKTL